MIALLNAAVEHYAYALELFDAWQAQRATSTEDVQTALTEELRNAKGEVVRDAKRKVIRVAKPAAQQLEYLRRQIEMRVLALGWTQYSTRWSSKADSRIGTVAHLTALLEEILIEEMALARLNKLPTEPAPPHHEARDLGQLGTADADALEIQARALFSADELRAKAEVARQRRVVDGVADPVQWQQQKEAPVFDQSLVGKYIEVLWKYFDKDTKKPQLIWATGRIARVADGLSDRRSARAKKLLPAGAVLWAWDADPEFDERAGEQWLILLPKKWNGQQHYSWRLDPRELRAPETAAPADRPRNVRPASE